jgi:hypothetical protein
MGLIGDIAGAAGTLYGAVTANTRRKQQMADQQKLMGIQQQNQMALNAQGQEYQKELNLQGQQLAQQNWDYTNAENQVKHYENAGLNVGLMYGGSGSGGTLASGSGGSANSGGAVGGSAPTPENPGIMGIQLAQLQSQVELNKAMANKANADANDINKKQPGAIEGQSLQNASTNLSNQLKQFDIKLAEGTVPSQIEIAKLKESQQAALTTIDENKAKVSSNTTNEEISKIKSQAALAEVQIQSAEAGIKLTKAQTAEINQEIEYYQKRFELDARKVGAQEAYNKNLKEFQDSMIKQGYWKMGVDGVTNVAKIFMNPTSTISETLTEGMKDKEGGYWNKTTHIKK